MNGVYVYDYFVKDHLGNTRMVLTDELQQDTYPAATLENGATTTEGNYYAINTGAIVDNPAGLPVYQNNNGNPPVNPNPTSTPTATSQKMYKLNGQSGDKTGLGITVKVMSGDNVMIYGKSFWHTNGSSPTNSYNLAATDLLTLLAGTPIVSGANKVTSGSLTGSTSITNGVTNWLSNAPATGTAPKAYVNWILFDEQFKPVSGSSGFDAVSSTSDDLKSHGQNVSISQNGYLYVYASNESNVDVFFDNLQLIHNHGPLLEETHYYPFGLTMAGISSKASGKLENRKEKFQGQEYNDDLGVNMYEFRYRMDDPQTGRFWQVDPLASKFPHNSTYAFSENKVTNHVELEGLESVEAAIAQAFRSGGLTKSSVTDMGQRLLAAGEKYNRIAKDAMVIAGGVTVIAASGGIAAAPLATVGGSLAIAGGSAKLILDINGDYSQADNVPTTISGTVIFTINEMRSDGKSQQRKISKEFQATAEFIEGLMTFDIKDFSKTAGALKNTNATISAVSLLLDGTSLSEDAKKALIDALSSAGPIPLSPSNKPLSDHPEDNKAKREMEMKEKMNKVGN